MSDLHLNFSALPHERPGDDDAREARHQVLATLLGAYADGELPAETSSQIDAHLLGCARCRREVDVHAAVRARLSHEPVVTATLAFRERIRSQIAQTPLPSRVDLPAEPPRRWWHTTGARVAMSSALVASVALFAVAQSRSSVVAARPMVDVTAASIPLFTQIVGDYRHVISGDLPGRARDLDAVRASVPFPVQPLQGADLRLLAAWSTDLEGEPAAVLAYRWHDRLVFSYLTSEPTFFRHSGLRTPVAAGHLVAASIGAQGLLAWAAPESGVVLIGDVSPAELAALRVGGAGR